MKEHFLRGIRDGRVASRIGVRSGSGGSRITDAVQKRLIRRELQYAQSTQELAAYITGAIIGQLRSIGTLFIKGNTPDHIIVTLDKDGRLKKD